MFNITTSIFYTSGVIQIISLSFILVSMFFVILLLRYVPHFCFREILNFSYPNFYKFLFGHQTDSFDNNSGEGKYIYFKINVILSSAFIRYIFLTFLYYFALSHNISNSLLTPFSIVMSVFGVFIFEVTIIQFFIYLGVEVVIEFTFFFRFIMNFITLRASGIVYSMLTLMRDVSFNNGTNNFKQRNSSFGSTHLFRNKGPRLTVSFPSPYALSGNFRSGSVNWHSKTAVKGVLSDPSYLIHRNQKKLPVIFEFADFKSPKYSNNIDVITEIRDLIEIDNLLVNIGAYIEIGVRNPKDLEIFKGDLGAQSFLDFTLKRSNKGLNSFRFVDFIKDISTKTAEYDFVTKGQYLLFIRSSLIEHFPEVFSGNNWASKNSRDFLGRVHMEVQKLADQSCVSTILEKIYPSSKVMPIPDNFTNSVLVSKNINFHGGRINTILSAISDFIILYADGTIELIESKFRSSEYCNEFLKSLGYIMLNSEDRTIAFLKYAFSLKLNSDKGLVSIIDDKIVEFKTGYGPLGLRISNYNEINLKAFISDFVVSCDKNKINCASITHTFDDFYEFFSVDKFMEEWVKARRGSIEYFDDYAVITIEPQRLVELEIKELREYSEKFSKFIDFENDKLVIIEKRLENLEAYKNFFVCLDSVCSESNKKVECTVRLILRVKN